MKAEIRCRVVYSFDENIGLHVVKITSNSIKRSRECKFNPELSGIALHAYHCKNDEVNRPLSRVLVRRIRGNCAVEEPHIPWGLATTTNEGRDMVATINALKKCMIYRIEMKTIKGLTTSGKEKSGGCGRGFSNTDQ